jgi:hypothetical protein
MLFAVMIVVGTVTYVAVFNLNNIVEAFGEGYARVKRPWVKRMGSEDKPWQTRAANYSAFKPKNPTVFPSEWWVVWYVVGWPFRRAWTAYVERQAQHQKSDAEAPVSPRLNPNWLLMPPIWRSFGDVERDMPEMRDPEPEGSG